ncbi:hypothetical protein O181_064410 [Austropuccinia psidii MF-1]|uniref:Chromo domain-containing protein n=1 Tax=Austropuccinia psidii MF-1 TaxID=1389203 RepID=A0A9Q3I344_9BASI|nr:hypothetical protein [Austropuccinia psidii MF-1]
MLEEGWNPILQANTLRKYLIEVPTTASSFKIMLEKVKHHAKQSMDVVFDYAKQKWDKRNKVPDLKVGGLVLVSTLNFDNIKGPKKLKDYYVGSFVIVALHGNNAFQVELSGELENKQPTLYPTPLTVPPVEQNEDKKIKKVIKERRLRGKNQREYLIRYRNPVHEMNGWQNQKYLTKIMPYEDLDMKEGDKPEYVYKYALNYLISVM